MEINTLEDIKKLVKEYGEGKIESADGDAYFIIKKELADGIKEWLFKYSRSENGKWLEYDLAPFINAPEMYLLKFYI